jgi:DNA-binding Xre family transcriptional regulator
MGKVVTHLRRLRLQVSAQRGLLVSMQEVADAVGMRRDRLNFLELGKFERVDTNELLALSTYYATQLNREVNVGDLLEIDANSEAPIAA